MPMATIHKMGQGSDLYHIHFLDQGGAHPDHGLPGQGGRPDQGLPGGGHVGNRPPGPGSGGYPDNTLPGGGRPDQGLPGGGHVSNRPPGSGSIPGIPDNSLPTTPPPQVAQGQYLVMVRAPDGKWKWATVTNPPTHLPEQPQPKQG